MAYTDSVFLGSDVGFQSRVKQALLAACNNVATEAITQSSLQLHIVRDRFATQVLAALANGAPNWVGVFSAIAGNDTTCLAAATTQAGGSLTSANTPAAALAVPDADINNAIAANWNAFCTLA